MSRDNCCCKHDCVSIAIVASIIIGIITAILQVTTVITLTPAVLWVVFGIAVGYLAILLLSTGSGCSSCMRDCSRAVWPVLLAGILGTILFALILLGVEFAAISVPGAILGGLLLASFALTITSTVCLVKCLVSTRR